MKEWFKKNWGWVLGGTVAVAVGLYLVLKGESDETVFDYDSFKGLETPAIFEGKNLTVEEVVALLGMDEYILQGLDEHDLVPSDISASLIYDYYVDCSDDVKYVLGPIVYEEGL